MPANIAAMAPGAGYLVLVNFSSFSVSASFAVTDYWLGGMATLLCSVREETCKGRRYQLTARRFGEGLRSCW